MIVLKQPNVDMKTGSTLMRMSCLTTASRNSPLCTRRVCRQGCGRSWARVELENPSPQRVAKENCSQIYGWTQPWASSHGNLLLALSRLKKGWGHLDDYHSKPYYYNSTHHHSFHGNCIFRHLPPILCWSIDHQQFRGASMISSIVKPFLQMISFLRL